jgi:heat shock protein HspQ
MISKLPQSNAAAKFRIGQVVRHRLFSFRGVIFDVDPVFSNTEEWWNSIPAESRPSRDQPFYHLLAENNETEYVAYVSEQNLQVDDMSGPVRHPQVSDYFSGYDTALNRYIVKPGRTH